MCFCTAPYPQKVTMKRINPVKSGDSSVYGDFKTNIAIVGTGPSGIYCTLQLVEEFKNTGQNNYQITLFDPLDTLTTILPTGNGRCNLAYAEDDFKKLAAFYPRGEKFLYSIFSRYSTSETLAYFDSIGIKTYEQQDRRIFPVSNSAKNIRAQMIREIKKSKNIKIIKKCIKNKEELRQFNVVVLATGSKDRYELAKQFGHTVIPFKPALCGLKVKEITPQFPTGVSIDTKEGGIIFTHQGISGPAIFKISSINVNKEFPYEIKIPIINKDTLLDLLHKCPKKSFLNVVSSLIPRVLAQYIFERYNIDGVKQACHAAKAEIETLENLTFTIVSTDGKGEIVHAGGVLLDEIDKNCKSKIANGLWIIGESLNIDGFCGGFNLQNCWSTGAIAAQDIVKSALNQGLSCFNE